ncbi:hypothetical protein X798_01632 [Onchocerca flexuosa]|uniref:SLC12A transporter C-terminal domain-containing protein n=1 Tax=Onchocerca flexuosa TaxID=387005 RepID=A0A238C243_9BILA|nr:hypothetical protein X798_01632 [Onchocerca flexuosa]
MQIETTFTRDRLSVYSPEENDFHDDESWEVVTLEAVKRVNDVIVENSKDSHLVLLSLPHPPINKEKILSHYMSYIDVLALNLKRILFIGGSGKEVVTINT